MRKRVPIFIFIVFCLIYNSCSIGRYLDSPAYVIIDGPNDVVVSDGDNKYLNINESETYEMRYLIELESELEQHNVFSLHKQPENAEKLFIILISELSLEEESKTEIIESDTIFGATTTYNIVSCDVDSKFDVYYAGYNGNELLKSLSAYSFKEEKLSNKRTFWQMIFRVNADNSIYTYTELQDDVFLDLCEKNARTTAAKISKVLYKSLK